MSEAERIILEARAAALELELRLVRERLGGAAPSPAPPTRLPAPRRRVGSRVKMPAGDAPSELAEKQIDEFLCNRPGLVRRGGRS